MLEKQENMKIELERKKEIVKGIALDRENFGRDRKDYIESMRDNHLKQISVNP